MRRLVALLAVALLAVACLAGCTGGPTGRPTGGPTGQPGATRTSPNPAPSESDDVRELLARPLELPSVKAGERCPVTPAQEHQPVAQPADSRGPGPGPLYPISFYLGEDATLHLTAPTPDPDGFYETKVVWASTGAHQGPVVVRVGRLDGPGRGRVRLYYDPAASRGDAVVVHLLNAPDDWPSATDVTGPGCYAYRLDGRGFTQVIVFRVVA